MSGEKKENLRFLVPVEKIPGKRKGREPIYDEIIKEFVESNLKYAEVKLMGKAPSTINQVLRKRLKEKKIDNIKVRYRNKKVYLERLE